MGIDVIVPLASFETAPSITTMESAMSCGSVLQWDPIMGKNGRSSCIASSFKHLACRTYDRNQAVNPSSNFFSFDPYWAGTLFITPQWEVSLRLHYLWNAKNDDPFVGFGVNEIQAGQAVHANFATSYEVIAKKLRLGSTATSSTR